MSLTANAKKLPKKAPAWYTETMFAFVVASCVVDISMKRNSLVKDGSASVVPMKAESYPIMHDANDAMAAQA